MTGPDDLGDLLLRVARRLRRANLDALGPLGLNPHQARALRLIEREQPLRPSELAARLGIAPRSATEVLDGLVAGGWVERSPDPDDRRASLARLTPAGLDLASRVAALRREGSQRLLAVLDADERRSLATLLARLDAEGSMHHPK